MQEWLNSNICIICTNTDNYAIIDSASTFNKCYPHRMKCFQTDPGTRLARILMHLVPYGNNI